MGYIASVSDPYTGIVLKKFGSVAQNTDLSFNRRSGTFAVLGADGGVDPFGASAMPVAIRTASYQFREYFHKSGGTTDIRHANMDAARDNLMMAVGGGLPVRLEYMTDSKTSRYCIAKARDYPHIVTVDSDLSADFRVSFEMADPFWSDLFPANVTAWGHFLWGDGTTWGGAPFTLNPVAAGTTVFNADLTGATAFDLPKMTINGVYGGSNGFVVNNQSVQYPTANGPAIIGFQYLEPLLANESVTIDSASLSVTKTLANGTTVDVFDKLYWSPAQRYIFMVDPRTKDGNPVNVINLINVGSSPTTGGKGLIVFTKRYW